MSSRRVSTWSWFAPALWVGACALAAALSACAKVGEKRVTTTTTAPTAAPLPEFELLGPARTLTPVSNPGPRPVRLETNDHRAMYDQGFLWMGSVRSRLNEWQVGGKLRQLGITHWYARVFSKTVTTESTYCTDIEIGAYGSASCGMFSIGDYAAANRTATAVERTTTSAGVVGDLFVRRDALPEAQRVASEKAWADVLVSEALQGRPVLDLALALGATGDSSVNGRHWIDGLCQRPGVGGAAGWAVAALLERKPQLDPGRAECLQQKFFADPMVIQALLAAGDSGEAAVRAAVAAGDCQSASILKELGAAGAACPSVNVDGPRRARALSLVASYVGVAERSVVPLVKAVGRVVGLQSVPSAPSTLFAALVRWRESQAGRRPKPADPPEALLAALLAAGASPNEMGELASVFPGAPRDEVNATELAVLLENRGIEARLRAAGGTVDPARLAKAQAALAGSR